MSLTARLHIEGHSQEDKGIEVINCEFSFTQDIDLTGKGASKTRAGLIKVTVKGSVDSEIYHWMLGTDIRKNGKIAFSGVEATGPRKAIIFQDALLVEYHESFAENTDIITQMNISSRKIELPGGVIYESTWDPGQ